jgi:signal transduction histidine kinase
MAFPSKTFDIHNDSEIDLDRIAVAYECGGNCLGEKIIQHFPHMILAVNGKGLITGANYAAEVMLDLPVGSIGKRLSEILVFSEANIGTEIESALAQDGIWRGETEIEGANESVQTLSLAVKRIPDETSGGRYIDFYLGCDVTTQKHREREIRIHEKIVARAEMAGEIAHELNNYLSIVLGNLELMGMSIDRGKFDNLAGRVKSVREGMSRIAKFIDGLMAVQNPENQPESLDLNRFLGEEIRYFKTLHVFDSIEFVCDLGNDIPAIKGDRCRLQQALYNIFLNSAEALAKQQAGHRKISVSTSYASDEGLIKIAIGDSGGGMAVEDYDKLFRQFFTTKGRGRGFGLLAVKGAIKSFGGRISAGPGSGGACFTIAIPVGKTAQQSSKTAVSPGNEFNCA